MKSTPGNKMTSLRRELLTRYHKIKQESRTRCSYQEGILPRITALETPEESLQFSSTSIEEIHVKNKILSDGFSVLKTHFSAPETKIKQLEDVINVNLGCTPEVLTCGLGVFRKHIGPLHLPYDAVKQI